MLMWMNKGGVLMWVILFNALIGVYVFIERLFHFHRAQINTGDFVRGILNSLRHGNIIEAISTCGETPGPVSQVVKAAIVNHDRSREEIREAIQDTARTEVARLEHNLTILATLAQVAPLIGFLGTVWGMISIFRVIEKTQLASPGQLAGGVWVALLTTAAGLVVAIPSYIAYNYLVTREHNLVLDMEHAANEVVNFLMGHGDESNLDEPIILGEKRKR